MSHLTDVRCTGTKLYFLPVHTRVPLKFGTETVTYITCARVCMTVEDRNGRRATGWGETPLSVQWVWPGSIPYEERHSALKNFCVELAQKWTTFEETGHPIEIGSSFQENILPGLAADNGKGRGAIPRLAALVCCSPFDIALHDAYGNLVGRPVYETYGAEFLNRDLAAFLSPAAAESVDFSKKFPADFLSLTRPETLPAWHLVGGLDPLDESELTGNEPRDGYPVTLTEWIETDGLRCLKIKLRGTDAEWDYARLVKTGMIALERGVEALSADFNCTVTDPAYVNEILDRLKQDEPRIFNLLLYVEQPFPYDLEANRIDVHSVSSRNPLFLDESAHDWRMVRLGRELGWTGVALKTCKTQTGALLSACWAKAHGMPLMVQDLTNPMLAQIPHVLLAAHVGTIKGVETNAMQFYPEASTAEAEVHPGIYRRKKGEIKLATISGNGFGYRLEKMNRELPQAAVEFGM